MQPQQYNQSQRSNRRNLILVIVTGVVLIVLMYGGKLLSRNDGGVIFAVSPSDTTITVDGHKTKLATNKKVAVAVGEHKVDFTRTGFTSQQKTIIVNKTDTRTVSVILEAVTDDAKDFMKNNQNEKLLRESLTGQLAKEQSDQQVAGSPITLALPHIDPRYRIDYGPSLKYPSDSSKVTIYITAGRPDYRQFALAWIRARGYDPSDMEIVFR